MKKIKTTFSLTWQADFNDNKWGSAAAYYETEGRFAGQFTADGMDENAEEAIDTALEAAAQYIRDNGIPTGEDGDYVAIASVSADGWTASVEANFDEEDEEDGFPYESADYDGIKARCDSIDSYIIITNSDGTPPISFDEDKSWFFIKETLKNPKNIECVLTDTRVLEALEELAQLIEEHSDERAENIRNFVEERQDALRYAEECYESLKRDGTLVDLADYLNRQHDVFRLADYPDYYNLHEDVYNLLDKYVKGYEECEGEDYGQVKQEDGTWDVLVDHHEYSKPYWDVINYEERH